jgi:integrase
MNKDRTIVKALPEYLDVQEVVRLIESAPHADARLLILVQWRAGVRVSEALALRFSDFQDGDNPTLRVRRGKGRKPRLVPIHPELHAGVMAFQGYRARPGGRDAPLFTISRTTAWKWVKQAATRANLGAGRKVGTHTLRHSAARHWLASGVPLNVVSRWLGHAGIQQTLVYLEILPDPSGYMERVP